MVLNYHLILVDVNSSNFGIDFPVNFLSLQILKYDKIRGLENKAPSVVDFIDFEVILNFLNKISLNIKNSQNSITNFNKKRAISNPLKIRAFPKNLKL